MDIDNLQLKEAESIISNDIYAAASLFDKLENANRLKTNAHHLSQELAAFAQTLLRKNWVDQK